MLRVVALVAVAFHLATGQTVDALDQPFEQMGLLQGRGRDQLKVEENALENQTAETQKIIVEDQTVENQTANNTAGGWRSVKVRRKVCIRAKGGKPGRLSLPRHMRVSQVIFTYRKARGHSGLTCRGHGKAKHRSNWGCDGGKLGLVITKRNKKVVMPRKSQKISGFSRTKHKHAHWYTMKGVTDKSPQMRWRLRKPFNTGKNQRYQVWYNENLSKGTVGDNAGRACYRVDVFGRAPARRPRVRCHLLKHRERKKCFKKLLQERSKCVSENNDKIIGWMKKGMKENVIVRKVMALKVCDSRPPTAKRALWIAKYLGRKKKGELKAVRMMKRAARRQKLQKCKRAPKNRKGQRALKALSAIKKVLGSLGQTNRRRRARKANRRRRAKKVTMRKALAAKRWKCKHHQNLKRKYTKSQTGRRSWIKKNCGRKITKTCNKRKTKKICNKRKTRRMCKKKQNAQSALCKQCTPCNNCQRKKTTFRRINNQVNRFHRHCKVLKGRYMLKTHHRKYVRASGRSVTATARKNGLSMIQVMNNRDGTVSLKTSKGKYFTAEKNGALNARAQGKGKRRKWNQKFLVIFNKGRTVSFMSVYNKYVVAEKNGRMNANRAWNRAWEKFRVVRLPRKRVLLQVPNADVPTVEVPTVEVPNAELPNAELPNAELPNAELSNAELPNVELLNAKPPNAEGKP